MGFSVVSEEEARKLPQFEQIKELAE